MNITFTTENHICMHFVNLDLYHYREIAMVGFILAKHEVVMRFAALARIIKSIHHAICIA